MKPIFRVISLSILIVLGALVMSPETAMQVVGAQPAVPDASCANLGNWECVETRPGLSLCRANDICIVQVNLNNVNLRPHVVIAPGGGVSWVSSMASNAGALAAINGDYFSGCPDPNAPYNCGQGLTFVNGVDYTNYDYSNWQNRRSLGYNDSYDPNIGWPGEQGGYHRYLLGGGPQVTFSGAFNWRCWYQSDNTYGNCACINDTVVINDELFGCSANNWWNRPQTFVGFSEDRNTLFMAASLSGISKTVQAMHDVLWVYGARQTLRMDGGTSTSMYFNDGDYQFSWEGQQVANAWVIVWEDSPPPTCNPGTDQIALYVDPNYLGQCVVKGVGEYRDPASIGLPNDSISSLRVGSSVKALLCRDDNYTGTCQSFTADDPNLGDNEIGDNQVSSAKVEWRGCNPTSDQVAIYSGANFSGNCVTLGIGDYPNPGYLSPVSNDDAESIRVGSNVQAILCEHDNYGGVCQTFTYDDGSLADDLIGANSVSSVRVQTRPQPQPDLQPFTPSGYQGPVVPASIVGTHIGNTLYAGYNTYFDWYFTNSGIGIASGSFYVDLWIDGDRRIHYPFADFGVGYVSGFDDWAMTVDAPGWHTLRLVVDTENTIAESNEANNTWESQFYWNPVLGWWGEYFNNENLSGPAALVRDDPVINFEWAYDSPGDGVNADQFSVRWTRNLYLITGTYQFAVTHDDGARLWIDGILIVDAWDTCCQTEIAEADLSSGDHVIQLEMYEHDGAATAILEWEAIDTLQHVFLPFTIKN